MKRMTPREALYYVCLELGPTASTKREDNIHHEEARLRDAVRVLQNFVTYHNDADKVLPDSVDEFVHIEPSQESGVLIRPRVADRGDGKERLDAWKEEVKHRTFVEKTKY
jgi:hypothetical protein